MALAKKCRRSISRCAPVLALSTRPGFGVVENSFLQHGKPHAEINIVFELKFATVPAAEAKEDWIEFEWRKLEELGEANLLPEAFRVLSENPDVFFAP